MNSESKKIVTRVVTNKKSEIEASVEKVDLEEVAEKVVVEKDKSFKERAAEASATVALKAAIEANSAVALNTAEKTYSIEKRRHMLTRCKNDKEVPFVVNKDNNIIHGFIDLLAKDDNETIIIDFKTDHDTTEEILKDRYSKQIELYLEAVQLIYPQIKVKAYIYALTLKSFIEITNH